MTARRASGTAPLDGILVVAKPAGPTSHDVVALVRRLSGVRRVGHGGTLDPFATGVLPVFLGRATRMVEYHLADAKGYRAAIVLGARSSTDDLDGQLTAGDVAPPARTELVAALAGFRGDLVQVPPDHSAVHVSGRRAYEMARGGEKPRLTARRVVIHHLELTAWDDGDPDHPVAELDIRCSAGTYIRALARDLGDALGCGAYLGALTRTASGPFRLADSLPLELVREELEAGRAATLLRPLDAGLEHLPAVRVVASALASLARGQVIPVRGALAVATGGGVDAEASEGATRAVRVMDEEGRLAAMAHIERGRIVPDKVLVAPAV
jgi:tRNA pseudouridine55 synthase